MFKIIWAGKLLHTTISFSQLAVHSTIVMTLARALMYIHNLGHMLVDICEIWQKVLVRELAKSAYIRCASSE